MEGLKTTTRFLSPKSILLLSLLASALFTTPLPLAAATQQGAGAEMTPAAATQQGAGTELTPAATTQQRAQTELTPAAATQQEAGTELTPAAATQQGAGSELTPAAATQQGAGSELTPAAATQQGAGSELTPAAATQQGAGSELTSAAATQQRAGSERTPAAATQQGAGTERTPAAATHQGAETELTPAAATQQGAVTELTPAAAAQHSVTVDGPDASTSSTNEARATGLSENATTLTSSSKQLEAGTDATPANALDTFDVDGTGASALSTNEAKNTDHSQHSSPSTSQATSCANIGTTTVAGVTTSKTIECMASTPVLTDKDTRENCYPEFQSTNNASGEFAWGFYCYQSCLQRPHILHIVAPKAHGFVLEFHHMQMQEEDSLTIYGVDSNGSRTVKKTFTKQSKTMAPLMLYVNEIEITFPFIAECTGVLSKFNFSYQTHPRHSLPNTYRQIDGHDAYNCDGMTNLPEAISCDGIRHCTQGEDEENCPHREEGCGDWYPYKDQCLKAIFIVYELKTMQGVLEAEEACQQQHGATLAALPDLAGQRVMADMAVKSGRDTIAVGIKKVQPVSIRLSQLYRFLWQWGPRGSPIAYEQQQLENNGALEDCAVLKVSPSPHLQPVRCVVSVFGTLGGYICMKPNPVQSVERAPLRGITFQKSSSSPDAFPTKTCPDGSVVQTFHRCYWGKEEEGSNPDWSLNNLPLFECRYGRPIHYSLVCDGKDDCLDRSDEMDCQRPRFSPLLDSSYICRNFQAVPVKKRCDGMIDCLDGSDEEFCASCEMKVMCPGTGCLPYKYIHFVETCPLIYPIALVTESKTNLRIVELDGYGMSSLKPSDTECGEGFYQCQDGFCIPTFLLNNGEQDCPKGEDEGIPVNSVTCPGYYRCQEVGTCVHKNYTCDGVHHCPYKDDELFCDLTCPHDSGCVCEGQAYTCSKMIDPLQHLHLRYLDLSSASSVSMENLHFLEYLVFLNLSFCRLVNVTVRDMPQLQTLDLSSNLLTHLSSLSLTKLPGLMFLDVSHNPLARTLGKAFGGMINVGELLNLKSLIFVNVSLQAIENRAFSSLSKLTYLDVRTNPLRGYKKEALYGLVALEEMFTDETKLCCSYFHSTVSQCHAPVDELSSCSDLLAQGVFKVFLWTLSGLAIVGNVGVLVYRAVVKTQTAVSASDILVKSLCASDLLMGVYLMMIGVADAQLSGRYVAEENEWKGSVTCTVAGFLSLVSTEVSALMVCLVTLERVLVLCFPFRARLHFSPRVAVLLCLGTWISGVMLASVPLLASLEFYGQTSICIPLPITRQQFSGQQYAFGIFIVFNFVVFLFIGAGQLLIYRAVNKASAASGTQRRSQEMKVARRLFLIILTDFGCWFPIGVMGLLAARGVPIPAVINVWAAIFVLPLNSALNPFLYTLNGLLERLKKQRKQKRMKKMLGTLQKEIPTWKRTDAQELIKICVRSGAVDKSTVAKILGITVHSLRNGNNSFTGHGDKADCHVSMEVSNMCYEPDSADMTQGTQYDSQL